MIFTDAQQEFIDNTVAKAKDIDEGAAVLLVGSMAAGYTDSWSDLDLWILGDKENLREGERQQYSATQQVFFDDGELERHYVFYDVRDLESRLSESWRDDLLWLLRTSHVIHDPKCVGESLKVRFEVYPQEILERKLRWWLCKYWESQSRLEVSGRGMPVPAVLYAAKCIEAASKVCCLAEGKAFPYSKWLRRAIAETKMGKSVAPIIDRVVENIHELVSFTGGTDYRELVPVKELRSLKATLQEGLKEVGWCAPWVDEPGHHVWVVFNEPCP